ncbi:MAG: methyl-accepting chemotaxis protein [Pseudomonas sp. PGPPP3]|nr:MAG: methyl-accepting chemotaxis protein [Pseudomonas sp. PGPPP3]
MGMHDIKVVHRLFLLIIIPLLAMLGMLAVAINGFSRIDSGVGSLYDDRVVPLQQLKQISDYYAVNIIDAVNKADHGLFSRDQAQSEINTAQREIERLWQAYMATQLTPRESQLAEQARSQFSAANTELQRLEAFLQGAPGDLKGQLGAFNGQLYQSIDPISSSIGELIQLQLDEAKLAREAAAEAYHNVRNLMIGVVLFIVAISLLGGRWVAGSISQPLGNLLVALRKADKDSDLTALAQTLGNNEISSVASAYNNMLQRFSTVITALQELTESIRNQTEELSAVTLQTRTDVERQQHETDQVATATTQMAETIQEVARNAASAAQAANSADHEAVSGSQMVSHTLQAVSALFSELENTSSLIGEVESASNSIGTVLEVIRSIAEQTNLLALNAAIEAARAGDQGRGFAVVADEVRNLAKRTQESTAEIDRMILRLQKGSRDAVHAMHNGQDQAKQTVNEAGQADGALHSIRHSVDTIMAMNTQIASATEEQTAVAHEINRNLITIHDVAISTQQAVSHIDQTSHALAEIVVKLLAMTRSFQVKAAH